VLAAARNLHPYWLIPMMRYVLPTVTVGLVAMILVDRSRRPATVQGSGVPAALAATSVPAAPARRAPVPATVPAPPAPAPASPTPTLDRLARLAVRRQLGREVGATYLDSLLVSTDSVVRRWPDPAGPLKVALVEGRPAGYSPRLAGLFRQALSRWTDAGVGVRFAEVTDTASADIVVHWIDRFDFDRAGQTDLTWDQQGRVRRAAVSLALRTSTGVTFNDSALLAVAVHEAGHAIGLPHSADSNDVMFPSTRTAELSARDIRTATVLYELPPGSVRDPN
jgi:Matrixin